MRASLAPPQPTGTSETSRPRTPARRVRFGMTGSRRRGEEREATRRGEEEKRRRGSSSEMDRERWGSVGCRNLRARGRKKKMHPRALSAPLKGA
jgi:hypothetical protein